MDAAFESAGLKNYYAILEVPVGCSLEEIRQAYHRLVQAHLDDEALFAELKEAYEVLTTPTRRAEYDKAAWGETFDSAPPSAALSGSLGAGRCPMGPEEQCPVVQGRAVPADRFCPDCGYAVAGLASGEAFEPASGTDLPTGARLHSRTGQSYPLRAGVNSVGREDADVLIFDKTVSRAHARLQVAGDGAVSVEDLGSTNGTKVGGDRLIAFMPRPLRDGDPVQFGSVALTAHLPGGGSAPGGEAAGNTQARLFEIQGTGAAYALPPGVTTFGRRPENTVVLTGDLYVSGVHARISADGDRFVLTDIGSTNGTLHNGERLEIHAPVALAHGDVVVIGATALRFERLGPDGAALPEAEPEDDMPTGQEPAGDEPPAAEHSPAHAEADKHAEAETHAEFKVHAEAQTHDAEG